MALGGSAGLKLRNTYRCYTVGRVVGSVIFMFTDAYGACGVGL